MRESFEQKTLNWAHQWLRHAQKEKTIRQGYSTSSLVHTPSLERWARAFYSQHQQEIQAYFRG